MGEVVSPHYKVSVRALYISMGRNQMIGGAFPELPFKPIEIFLSKALYIIIFYIRYLDSAIYLLKVNLSKIPQYLVLSPGKIHENILYGYLVDCNSGDCYKSDILRLKQGVTYAGNDRIQVGYNIVRMLEVDKVAHY